MPHQRQLNAPAEYSTDHLVTVKFHKISCLTVKCQHSGWSSSAYILTEGHQIWMSNELLCVICFCWWLADGWLGFNRAFNTDFVTSHHYSTNI